MAKDKVKQQAGKLQVFDPQDLFNRLISLALVLTSGGGDGLPISLTKIMGYELSQFPASLFETEYLMLATNKPQIIQMLIKAFYKLEGADRVVQKMKFRVIKKSNSPRCRQGNLLQIIPWQKGSFAHIIDRSTYLTYVK